MRFIGVNAEVGQSTGPIECHDADVGPNVDNCSATRLGAVTAITSVAEDLIRIAGAPDPRNGDAG